MVCFIALALILIIGLVLGSIAGYIFARVRFDSMVFGTIRLYQMSPEEEPIMTAELDKPLGDIRNHRHVLFKISHN